MSVDIKYLTVDEVIEINKSVLKEIKMKRADSHRIVSRKKIEDSLAEVQEQAGGVYWKAAVLLTLLAKAHAFDSGNRRTAYAAAKVFLEQTERHSTSKSSPKC